MLNYFDRLINSKLLLALAALFVLTIAAELISGIAFFPDSGMIHATVAVFVVLIVVRILSDYAYRDPILKTFSKIQVGFFLFLGIIHLYEFLGHSVFMMQQEIVHVSVLVAYLFWLLGNLAALEFVLRTYYRKSTFWASLTYVLLLLIAGLLIWLNLYSSAIVVAPQWLPLAAFVGTVLLAILASTALWKLKKIMPIFNKFAYYTIPGMVLVVFASLFQYTESMVLSVQTGMAPTNDMYLSHFAIFAALCLLLIAVGKFKRPTGIYAEE